ncbi:hypothetical protein [Galbibacter sp. BG1]
MAFTSISSRITDMPLVLVGPILRRVTDSSVSVFIVTKESKEVILNVYDASNTEILTGTSSTRKLGEHVHALTITAGADANTLVPNHVYDYNLEFEGEPMIKSDGTLTNGILVNDYYDLDGGIAYFPHKYPTFVLPANDINNLKFVHGSCRKPHGGQTDALRGLDTILSSTITPVRGDLEKNLTSETKKKINQRPQFLCLTGDQIYADDVADALLYIIMDMEETLFNWNSPNPREVLPSLKPNVEPPSEEDLKPGNRQKLVAEEDDTTAWKLSSGNAKSHLIKLAEFYSMYLLVWSDVLWPKTDDGLPEFLEVFPEGELTEIIGIPYSNEPKTEELVKFNKELTAIKEFKRSLPLVRRALANIPTYMMFDDHEITDDWFISMHWVQNILKDSLSERIIQNGLSAFVVFQAWGNTPSSFASDERGKRILDNLELLNTNEPSQSVVFNEIKSHILPYYNEEEKRLRKRNNGNINFYFNIDFDLFKLIVLDTRTNRGYVGPKFSKDSPKLIDESYLSSQIPSSTKNLAIIVSPAPVFGDIIVEFVQELAPGNIYKWDREAWISNVPSFELLLDVLSSFDSTVLLSGDVHYGFSITIDYWNNRTGTLRQSGIAQLCSSSLKNSDFKTEAAASKVAQPHRLKDSYEYLGWKKPGKHVKAIPITPSSIEFMNEPVSGEPAIYEKGLRFLSVNKIPDWQYRIIFEKDSRAVNSRISHDFSPKTSTEKNIQTGYKHNTRFKWDNHRYIVGLDNICFAKFSENGNVISHEFWYVAGPDNRAVEFSLQPSTIHKVNLAPPTDSDIPVKENN